MQLKLQADSSLPTAVNLKRVLRRQLLQISVLQFSFLPYLLKQLKAGNLKRIVISVYKQPTILLADNFCCWYGIAKYLSNTQNYWNWINDYIKKAINFTTQFLASVHSDNV